MLQFRPHLAFAGIELDAAPLFDGTYLERRYAGRRYPARLVAGAFLHRLGRLLRSRAFDLLWIEYELFPWLPALAEAVLDTCRVPYVVEYDDAVFHRYDRHRLAIVRTLLGGKIDRVMRHASAVVVGNAYLAERARHAGASRVVEIPSVVDITRYVPAAAGQTDPPVIGWIGSPTTVGYLRTIEATLASLCAEGRARVRLVGVEPGAERWSFSCEERRWTEETEVEEINGFDVGVMPLPDDVWERGKCGYKLVQYMACARPVVASPVGANREIVRDSIDGYLAATADDWMRALGALVSDRDLRERFGRAGRARAEERFTVQVVTARLTALFEEVAASRAA
jgi:glycosyltransferase involved in cell wall biosynthesis